MAEGGWELAGAAAAGFSYGLLYVLWLWQTVHRLGRGRGSPFWLAASLPARVVLPVMGVWLLPPSGWAEPLLYLCGFLAARQLALAASRRLEVN